MQAVKGITKKPWFLGMLVCLFLIITLWYIPIEKRKYGVDQNFLATDYTGLLPEKIARVKKAENRNELQRIVKEANTNGISFQFQAYSIHKVVIHTIKMV